MTIDVISDAIGPWYYVGKRRLEKAVTLAGLGHLRVRWHPLQLNPQMPKGSGECPRPADCLTDAEGDVVEALRKWEPGQLDYGKRLRMHGRRLGNRSQFD